jgi:hypothetical protein
MPTMAEIRERPPARFCKEKTVSLADPAFQRDGLQATSLKARNGTSAGNFSG